MIGCQARSQYTANLRQLIWKEMSKKNPARIHSVGIFSRFWGPNKFPGKMSEGKIWKTIPARIRSVGFFVRDSGGPNKNPRQNPWGTMCRKNVRGKIREKSGKDKSGGQSPGNKVLGKKTAGKSGKHIPGTNPEGEIQETNLGTNVWEQIPGKNIRRSISKQISGKTNANGPTP